MCKSRRIFFFSCCVSLLLLDTSRNRTSTVRTIEKNRQKQKDKLLISTSKTQQKNTPLSRACRAYKTHTHHIRERERDTRRDFYRHSRRRFNQTKHSHPFIAYQTENLKYVTRQRANEPLLGARGATTTARSFFINIIAAAAAATTTTTTKK